MNRPNILYLHTHDMGRYCQPYGYPVPTPAIQRLAEEGMLFRQAFAAAPTCSPSRAALVTGTYPHNCGMFGLAHRGFQLNDYNQHLVHTLRGAGYHSALVGVQHVAPSHEIIGYDERIQEREKKDTEAIAAATVQWLRDAPKQPFFLSAGFFVTHQVFPEPDPAHEDPRYCRPPAPLPDTSETRKEMAAFKAAARILDGGYAAILDALDETGLAGNTLVICTTDHGIAFPAMKCTLSDHGTGVMLILRGPGGFEGGRVCEAMVSHMDLFPTLCDLLEIDPPPWLQGASMMPLVHGEQDEIHDELFSEVSFHASFEPLRGVRTKRWKYIRRFDGRDRPVMPNCDQGPSKNAWLEHGWRERAVPGEQLYDLIFDPVESANLAGCAEHKDVLEHMRGRLQRWMRETDDPLLSSGIPYGPEAVANDPDALHPTTEEMRPVAELHGGDGFVAL